MCAGLLSDYQWQMDPRMKNAQIGSDIFRFKGAHSVRNTLKYILTVCEYSFHSLAKFVLASNFLHVAKTRVFEKSACFLKQVAQLLVFLVLSSKHRREVT